MSKILSIKPETLCGLFIMNNDECDGFKVVKDTIIHCDDEAGGGEHDYVIQEISTGNFYEGSYVDWDCSNTDYDVEEHECTGRVDFNCDLKQVFAKTKTVTYYS